MFISLMLVRVAAARRQSTSCTGGRAAAVVGPTRLANNNKTKWGSMASPLLPLNTDANMLWTRAETSARRKDNDEIIRNGPRHGLENESRLGRNE